MARDIAVQVLRELPIPPEDLENLIEKEAAYLECILFFDSSGKTTERLKKAADHALSTSVGCNISISCKCERRRQNILKSIYNFLRSLKSFLP